MKKKIIQKSQKRYLRQQNQRRIGPPMNDSKAQAIRRWPSSHQSQAYKKVFCGVAPSLKRSMPTSSRAVPKEANSEQY